MKRKFDDIAIEAGIEACIFSSRNSKQTTETVHQRIDEIRCTDSQRRAFLRGHHAGRCVDEVIRTISEVILQIDPVLSQPFRCAELFAGSVHYRLGPAFAGYTGSDRSELLERYCRWHDRFREVRALAHDQKRKPERDAIIRRDVPALLPELAEIAHRLGGKEFCPRVATVKEQFERLRLAVPSWMHERECPTPSFEIETQLVETS